MHLHQLTIKVVSDREVQISLWSRHQSRHKDGEKEWGCPYLVARVRGNLNGAKDLLPLFDGEAVFNVEHCLLPVSVASLRSCRGEN